MRLYILACGSRDWDDYATLSAVLSSIRRDYPEAQEVVMFHGAQRSTERGSVWGADYQWGAEARKRHWPVREFPVDWLEARRTMGAGWKRAGPLRNAQMLKEFVGAAHSGDVSLLVAAHDDPKLGSGTRDMVARALQAEVPCWWVRHDGEGHLMTPLAALP